jgi:hypothetical protein
VPSLGLAYLFEVSKSNWRSSDNLLSENVSASCLMCVEEGSETVTAYDYLCVPESKILYDTARVKKFINVLYFLIALLLYIYVGTSTTVRRPRSVCACPGMSRRRRQMCTVFYY